MQRWKENHYARASEFAQLIAEALGSVPAAAPHPTIITPPRPLPAANLPKPTAPSAAAVFKSIPWKK